MKLLNTWTGFAAAILVISVAAHASTFLGIDPMAAIPGIMWIHMLIFPPFFAAIYYANKVGGSAKDHQERISKQAPRWMQVMTGVCFVYAIVNFLIFIVLSEGGGPDKRDGKYFLTDHGRIVREITEQEYVRHEAYVVRGFSGHWMLFSTAALTLLVGSGKARRMGIVRASQSNKNLTVDGFPPARSVTSASATESPCGNSQITSTANELAEEKEAGPEPTTASACLIGFVMYAGCASMIMSGLPFLAAVSSVPITVAAVKALRRKRGFPNRSMESAIGCFALLPSIYFTAKMSFLVRQFVYVAIYAGLASAIANDVTVLLPKDETYRLSNGEPLNNHVWSALFVLVQFPLIAAGVLGLTYFAELVGRFVALRKKTRPNSTP